MEFIITDENRIENGTINCSKEVDMNIGGENDFQLTMATDNVKALGIKHHAFIYSPKNEYGGVFEKIKRSTAAATMNWLGSTWRGLLSKDIIEPPAGLAYRTVSGDAHTILKVLLVSSFGGLFYVPDTPSGIMVQYQFQRYCTMLDGISDMLATVSAKMKIQAISGEDNQPFRVQVSAEKVLDLSEEIEYSQDNKVSLTIEDYRGGINHLICLGSGQLTDRNVIHIYVQEDGSIGKTQFYSGVMERKAIFEYTNAEDSESLEESGKKKLQELMNTQKMTIAVTGMELDLGDIVGGRDHETGLCLKKPIVKKIIKVSGLKETITYKVEGGE